MPGAGGNIGMGRTAQSMPDLHPLRGGERSPEDLVALSEWLRAPERPLEPHWKVMGEKDWPTVDRCVSPPASIGPPRWQIEKITSTAGDRDST